MIVTVRSRAAREHRQMRADEGVEEPLLPERVGAEALDVGHVGVEDDRDVADASVAASALSPAGSSAADGHEVQRLVEVRLVLRPEHEVARR